MEYLIWNNLLLISALFLLLFVLAELIYHRFNIAAEYTRKFVHISGGLVTLAFPFLFMHWSNVAVLSVLFASILLMSQRYGYLPSINAVGRKSLGSVSFPLAIPICFYFQQIEGQVLLYYLPIMIMVISDPLACLIGRRWPRGLFSIGETQKSVSGTAAFFSSAFLMSFAYLRTMGVHFMAPLPVVAGTIATTTAFVEVLSAKGTDNITIPLAAAGVLYLFYQFKGVA